MVFSIQLQGDSQSTPGLCTQKQQPDTTAESLVADRDKDERVSGDLEMSALDHRLGMLVGCHAAASQLESPPEETGLPFPTLYIVCGGECHGVPCCGLPA